MHTLAQVEPALNLLRALDAGALFTRWAEDTCGETLAADVERLGPPYLFPDEITLLGMEPGESWAALRRAGHLVTTSGRPVARIGSVIAAGRIDDETCRKLTTTSIPLGKALGGHAHRELLWSSPGIDEYAVHACARVLAPVPGRGVLPVALATERVLRAWLAAASGA